MTTRKEALQELLAKVEAGSPDKEDVYAGWPFAMNGEHMHAWGAYNGSLDAAKALHEAVLPGWHFNVATEANLQGFYATVSPKHWGKSFVSCSESPARAWLIAILKALIAQEPEA